VGLDEYKRKRDFRASSEPKGKRKTTKPRERGARFVIQKHDASRLHYDFRLEMDGVLKSWAVPKGLPWIKGEKHLAVEVEDHPLDYASFEGIIPKGQYGGGTVMVWDRGTYEAEGGEPGKALRSGRLTLHMTGEKTRGERTLIRLRRDERKPQWLLLKTGEAVKPITKKRDDQSAKTGRTMKQIAAEQDAEWTSNRPGDGQPTAASRLKARIRKALEKRKSRAGHPKKRAKL
jgi:bifunctional non-homologous end joining protein LigD